jgi:toxin ParE1/3/4
VTLIFRPEARADLVTIAEFIAHDSVPRARQFVARLQKRCEILVNHPLAGRSRDEFGDGVRSLAERPYIIFYRLVGGDVEIVAFVHGARNLPGALRRRFEKDLD